MPKPAHKIIKVADKNGERTIDAEQIATFAHYIDGKQFRFIVTRVVGSNRVSVTHRASGKSVADVTFTSAQAHLGDMASAGRAVVDALVNRAAARHVAAILTAAEQE